MARAALGWTVQDLAEAADVGINTANRFERSQDARLSSVEKMRTALEHAGIEFTNGGQPGVRLRPIYVDASEGAELRHAGTPPVRCPTLQEAVIAWHKLPREQQRSATIKVRGGKLYKAEEIIRLHYGPRSTGT